MVQLLWNVFIILTNMVYDMSNIKDEQFIIEKIKYYEKVIHILSNKIFDLKKRLKQNLLQKRYDQNLIQIKDTHTHVCFILESYDLTIINYWVGYFPKESYPKEFLEDIKNIKDTYYTYDVDTFHNFMNIVNTTDDVIIKSSL